MEISQALSLITAQQSTALTVSLIKTSEHMAETALELIPGATGNNFDSYA